MRVKQNLFNNAHTFKFMIMGGVKFLEDALEISGSLLFLIMIIIVIIFIIKHQHHYHELLLCPSGTVKMFYPIYVLSSIHVQITPHVIIKIDNNLKLTLTKVIAYQTKDLRNISMNRCKHGCNIDL